MMPETRSAKEKNRRTFLRSMFRVSPVTVRLVITAKRPEIEIACPARPSVTPRSAASGVKRLTGMNSDAIRMATHSVMENTAPQAAIGLDAAPPIPVAPPEMMAVLFERRWGMEWCCSQ
jgi:hypothetical protein